MAGTIRVSRARHLRHRRLDGVERGGNVPRLKRLQAWLAARSTVLAPTASGTAFTAAAPNVVTAASHGLTAGEGPLLVSSTDTLPGGLESGVLYWAAPIDTDTFRLHRTRAEAALGRNPVAISDAGTGDHTFARAADVPGLIEFLRQENDPRTIQALTDIDDL